MCVYWLFCMKFNSKQLLFEQVFDIISNFCSIHPWRAYFLILMGNSIVHDHLCDTRLPTFETLSFFAYGHEILPFVLRKFSTGPQKFYHTQLAENWKMLPPLLQASNKIYQLHNFLCNQRKVRIIQYFSDNVYGMNQSIL